MLSCILSSLLSNLKLQLLLLFKMYLFTMRCFNSDYDNGMLGKKGDDDDDDDDLPSIKFGKLSSRRMANVCLIRLVPTHQCFNSIHPSHPIIIPTCICETKKIYLAKC